MNPNYGVWDYDDLDPVGWSECGEPYVRPTRNESDGRERHDLSDELAAREEHEQDFLSE